jgi:small GTP-binding protein
MEGHCFKIVIVGHVDHGKSTLIGRLFYDTGSLPAEKYEELKKVSEDQGKLFEFAHLMDHLKEERERGITIDTAQIFFKTDLRRYVIIDAPGHKGFLKNMITGASQAEAAFLLIDASEGLREQTKRHCYILGLLGLKQIIVLINKMDLVEYSESRFNELKKEILDYLREIDVKPSYVLPVSAREGDNIVSKSENMKWFDGLSVLKALDTFKAIDIESNDLRFPVQDIYDFIDESKLFVGRIESGTLNKGQALYALPADKVVKVLEIRKFDEDNIEVSHTGECIALHLGGDYKPRRGHILVNRKSARVTDRIRAKIFWMVDKLGHREDSYTFKCVTQEVNCKIDKVLRSFDPVTLEVVEKNDCTIVCAEIAEVELLMERPVVVDPFWVIAEMGRFVLEKEDYPIAGGTVI